MNRRQITTAAAALAAALTLTGCYGFDGRPISQTLTELDYAAQERHVVTQEAEAAAEVADLIGSAQLAPAQVTCEGMEPEFSDETLGLYLDPSLRDTGARDGATGEVTFDADGNPASYVVAAGDTESAIAARLCADVTGSGVAYLRALNDVRRGADVEVIAPPVASCLDCGNADWEAEWRAANQDALDAAEASLAAKYALHPGDVLNLSPYTITSVGSQGGIVYDNPWGDRPMPPQR